MKNSLYALAALSLSLLGNTAQAQDRGYYQSPTLNDEILVFSSEGDLWRTRANGGTAVRLTTHPEVETSPILSPDGQWIAFQASYDGPSEVYVISVTGGTPQRLTHEGGGATVRGWVDNDTVLYRTTNISGRIPRILRTIDRRSFTVSDIPYDNADLATLDTGSNHLFFTRYGLSMFSDNAVLYRGGRMAQLWRGDVDGETEAVRLAADFGAPIRHPMYANGRVYFVSDKSGADNIWSVDTDGLDPRQHTQRTQSQIRTPQLNNDKIVFQSGADLFTYDISGETIAPIDVFLMSDGDYQRERWIDNPLAYLESARMNPQGDALVVTARGRIASAFTGQRRRIDHQFPKEKRARSAAYSGDGESIYVILDHDDSGEIWRFPADGQGDPVQLTQSTDTHIWGIYPAPHDNTLLYSDKGGRLFLLDPETRQSQLIDTTSSGNDFAFFDFNWSAGGRYLTYGFYDDRDMRRVALYDTESGQKSVVTTGKFESFGPAISTDGAWLYFVSNRNFEASPGSPWGDRNMGPAFQSRGQIFAVQLDPDAAFPFDPPSELSRASKDGNGSDEAEDDADQGEADIPMNGLASRLYQVPVPAGTYFALSATEKHLFVINVDGSPILQRLAFTHQAPELSDFASNVQSYELSADGKKVFVQTGNGRDPKFVIVPADKDFPSDTSKQTVRLSDWTLRIDPKDEWRQLVLDAWRLHRDFAYDPNLRGVDWNAVRDRYVPLRDRIGHRSEVNDLLRQMAAELGILHSQVRGGDQPEDRESGEPSFLGATYIARPNGLEITSIYNGEPDRVETLGALQEPGVDVAVGDILQAVDGMRIRTEIELANALTMKAGEEVLLDFSRGGERRQEIVTPMTARRTAMLRYRHWVERNRKRVAEQSDDQIGYLHLRAMTSGDLASFARDFYEHHDKPGLIIDVRGNSGGNVDSIILSTLLRQAWAFWRQPSGGPATTNMQQTFRGHLAVLINEGTYSDGETFAAGIKALDLAPTIGTQTAGAGIWLSDRNPLSDRGQARIAEFAQYGADGRWLIEGRGVSPDIEVVNPPKATYGGEDAQLARALSYLTDKIAAEPVPDLSPRPLPPLGITGEDVE
nr:S41 family peptidase [Hyphomonas sp. Mor2]